MTKVLYGLSITARDYGYEEAWKRAGITYDVYAVGGGSAQYRFRSEGDKARAREIAAREIIQDFDIISEC